MYTPQRRDKPWGGLQYSLGDRAVIKTYRPVRAAYSTVSGSPKTMLVHMFQILGALRKAFCYQHIADFFREVIQKTRYVPHQMRNSPVQIMQ